MKKLLKTLPLITLLLLGCNKSKPLDPNDFNITSYMNPIFISDSEGAEFKDTVADPTIVRDGDMFYTFATGGVALKSEDAVTWEMYTRNIIEFPTWGAEIAPYDSYYSIWAPDVCKVGDNWIYYYSLSGWGTPRGIGYAVSTSGKAEGPYEDRGKLFSCDEIGLDNCIDSQTIIDDDGKVYMAMGSFQGLALIELEADGMSCKNGVEYQKANKTIIAGQQTTTWDGKQFEGSYIIKKGRYYYYFGSTGSCCEGRESTYSVRVARSENIKGPYVDSQGRPMTFTSAGTPGEYVVMAKASLRDTIAGPGHNSVLVDDKGDWWLYYHCHTVLNGFSKRLLFIDKLEWTNGYPHVKDYTPTHQVEMEGPWWKLK